MKKQSVFLIFLCSFLLVLASGLFGKTFLDAMAEEQNHIHKYYTGITIQNGDSLWTIADTYCHDGNLSIQEYVQELIQMNHLETEQIHAGQKLTIAYFLHE